MAPEVVGHLAIVVFINQFIIIGHRPVGGCGSINLVKCSSAG